MKVLIAEDEWLEREAMVKFLQRHVPEITVVAQAENGRKAIKLAKETQPELLLMDIKMPGLNGLEAMSAIREMLPSALFIMISAHDSFAFAKEALTLGAVGYILKPTGKEELLDIISSAQAKLNEMKMYQKKETDQLEELLMHGIVYGSGQIEELKDKLYLQAKSGWIIVMEIDDTVCTSNLKEQLMRWSEARVFQYEHDKKMIFLFLSEHEDPSNDKHRLTKRLLFTYGKELKLGIGSVNTNLAIMQESYYEALAMMYKKQSGFDANQMLMACTSILRTGDKGKSLEACIQFIQNKEFMNEQLFYAIQTLLMERKLSIGECPLDQLKTIDDWISYIERCCDQMKSYNQSMNQVERAKDWIQQNVTRSITLDDAARHVQLSPSYFSFIFKETTGATFTDYVTNHRLEKATKLLMENQYSLKEISYMVGYKDPNYFSKVFKKHFHVSPSHYRT
ncbi:response regulator [Bacillus sp. Marseille-P3800]|uniref:response regulator n=1 Tax=Bacillus sp. Marseille-P3800 TaxID=2014782 RepID=UPI000C080FF5|nr:response regulator [Bacillus sp. Marseille-P3800]